MNPRTRLLPCLLLVPCILLASAARASDGAIEINQALATQGGVTPGDAPGTPVTLSASGRYVLTGEIAASAGHGIEILADDVVLDLNGFSVTGATVCTGAPGAISCPPGAGKGIVGTGRSATVRSGAVAGFPEGGIDLGDESRVEDVKSYLNGGNGITVGARSAVSGSLALRNAGNGIRTGDDGAVRSNEASGNTGLGLVLGLGTGLTHNVLNENGAGAFSGGVVLENNVCARALTCDAVAELCDDADNDGDTLVDEDFPDKGSACSSDVGQCVSGTFVCAGDGSATECSGVLPIPEVCDGLDNDCDGSADDGSADDGNPDSGGACSTGMLGICAAGTTACTAGTLVCQQNNWPSAEVCDYLDNDCDGSVDDGNPGGGGACSTGMLGICAAGTTTCTAGALLCQQDNPPSAEVCDYLDNDCDGSVDDGFDLLSDPQNCGSCGNVCTGPDVCSNGSCVAP